MSKEDKVEIPDDEKTIVDDVYEVVKPFSPVLYNIGLCQDLGDMLIKIKR